MRIENLQLERSTGRAVASATIVWEDCDREPFELFFETEERFADDLAANPHAFVVAAFVPAMEFGERRLQIDEQICPTLRTGIQTAMTWMHHWFGPRSTPLRLETRPGAPPWRCNDGKRAGSFLSGGIDSLATLRKNRFDFPLDHPRAIKDCLFVHGFDIGGTRHGGREIGIFEQAWKPLHVIAADAQVELIPVTTNVRLLDDDVLFWIFKFCGAAISSVAHAFANRFDSLAIASSLDIPNLEPEGTHPLLDPNYSSAELSIFHDSLHLSRLDKVQLVADWDVALKNLRVCTMNPPEMPNCGVCEKCIRTMTELVAVGKLDQTGAFPTNDVRRELLETLTIREAVIDGFFRELIPALEARGRADLARVIRRKSAEYARQRRWEEERDWKGAVKKMDRRYLGSGLYRTYEKARRRVVDRDSGARDE